MEDSLRHEIESYVEGRLSAIKQELLTLQNQFNESVASLLDRQNTVPMEGSLATAIGEHLRAAQEQGIDLAAAESSRAKASSDMAIVKAGITEINEQNSQADILRTLVNRAASFAPRVAFFVVKGDQANGWRGRGFEGSVGDQAIQQISVPVSADTVLGSVVKSLSTWSGGPGSHADDHLILNRIGEEPPQRVVAVPLTVRNKPVAVLYADSGGLDAEAINLEALETLVRVSGMGVELLSMASAAPKRAEAHAPREEQPSYTPTSEYAQPAPAVEPSVPSDSGVAERPVGEDTLRTHYVEPEGSTPVEEPPPVAEAPVEFHDTAPSTEQSSSPWSIPTESSTEPAPDSSSIWSTEPEPQTTPAEAQAPTPQRRRFSQDAELPVDVSSDEERRSHNDARRFARLLISEIKLYNEQKVVEGRSEHDLYDRLREYIDRSREMYDKRVKPEVASRYDYFHGELVNTLAEGDVSKLGSNYPGATVTA
ncbi:MAG: hypothetical protein C5B55_14790 [Blastocatellia bacterium]|nr:MAG: hypothetical protein C5B55_14790 [Blastocatellia bacterium]